MGRTGDQLFDELKGHHVLVKFEKETESPFFMRLSLTIFSFSGFKNGIKNRELLNQYPRIISAPPRSEFLLVLGT